MKILDEDLKLCKSKTDDGEQLVCLPLEEIALQEIKPTFLKENINNIINFAFNICKTVKHIFIVNIPYVSEEQYEDLILL